VIRRVIGLLLFTTAICGSLPVGAATVAAGSAKPEEAASPGDCDAFYYGRRGVRQDFAKALSCYRAEHDWIMVALMQVNGEATPVDLLAARASIERTASEDDGVRYKDGDALALEAIIEKRKANPSGKAPRIDFCRDVATITPSVDYCDANAQVKKRAKSDAQLAKMRAALEPPVRSALDRSRSALDRFVKAEGERVYQEYVDGTSRNQEATDQEERVRRNFIATLKRILVGPAVGLAARRSFADADRELNVAYIDIVASYVKFNEEGAADARSRHDGQMAAEYKTRNSDFKTKSRAAQHEWVRYRDAMAELAAARWPETRDVRDLVRALVTEDRIRELRGK
jgi:hypothetical protein